MFCEYVFKNKVSRVGGCNLVKISEVIVESGVVRSSNSSGYLRDWGFIPTYFVPSDNL
jgi:hypothetical protein